jgi:hypothetical protein
MKKELVLLELEGTIISTFDDPYLLSVNVFAIQKELKMEVDSYDLGYFTYATYNQDDRDFITSLNLNNQFNKSLAYFIDYETVLKWHKELQFREIVSLTDYAFDIHDVYGDKRYVVLRMFDKFKELGYSRIIVIDDSFSPITISKDGLAVEFWQMIFGEITKP